MILVPNREGVADAKRREEAAKAEAARTEAATAQSEAAPE
jgi:hypothetical protein